MGISRPQCDLLRNADGQERGRINLPGINHLVMASAVRDVFTEHGRHDVLLSLWNVYNRH